MFRPLVVSVVLSFLSLSAIGQETPPVLEFPQPRIDDSLVYRGYTTRFFRDSRGNAVQVVLNANTGRVVHLWADASNESMSFTVRAPDGRPERVVWDGKGAVTRSVQGRRILEYTLASEGTAIELGHFLLCSMRKERDFQYAERHLLPFDSEPFHEPELIALINNVERLPARERKTHLNILQAPDAAELRGRLNPRITSHTQGDWIRILIEQRTFDGKNLLSLQVTARRSDISAEVNDQKIVFRSRTGDRIHMTVQIATDSPPLTPLARNQIFNREFLSYYNRIKQEYSAPSVAAFPADPERRKKYLRFARLERQIRSLELLSYQEKLMAGLPNFATYFGRDMIMSALMLEPVWTPSMVEHAISGILRKLSPAGEVSHEESLGGQTVRENAAEYNRLIEDHFRQSESPRDEKAALLRSAREILGNLQAVREDYKMIDDDFQFPVLVARYLARTDVPLSRKRSFMLGPLEAGTTTLRLILRNLLYVANRSAPYAERPDVLRLVSFPKVAGGRWLSGSWRDSNAGYAGGRFAMDINAIWVPKALQAMEITVEALREMNISQDRLEDLAPEIRNTPLAEYLRHPEKLRAAMDVWQKASHHFLVSLTPQQVEERLQAKLAWLPNQERNYWMEVMAKTGIPAQGIQFLALSLDSLGKPIPIPNTDPSVLLFLDDLTGRKEEAAAKIGEPTDIILTPFPVGLHVEGLGPLVANDAYATKEVWETYRKDRYHSPYVVWGREVNLLLLGFSKRLINSYVRDGKTRDPSLEQTIKKVRSALETTLKAVEASGLKHNELWTYRIEAGRLIPALYPTGSDIQLWNVTDLAVQFLLDHLPQ